ncbi:MAG: SAM-dependent methyltransferase [Alphaproteobacteria bacterium]
MSDTIFRKDGTAQGVAKQRLIETIADPHKRVIDDPYADKFVVGAGLIKLMGHKFNHWITQKIAPGFHEHIVARTRFIDDLVRDCADRGIEQYVILGAGYDLRAHRLGLPSFMRIFEVDQPEVQARKRSKLPAALPNSQNVTYVSVDFNHQTLLDQLLAAGFDQNKSTVFTLEGVSQYISKQALCATIGEVAALAANANAILFLSYVDRRLDENPEACFGQGYPNAARRAETIKGLSAKAGEPWISFYAPEELQDMLCRHGLVVKDSKTLADLNTAYYAPVGRTLRDDQIFNLEHFLVATS